MAEWQSEALNVACARAAGGRPSMAQNPRGRVKGDPADCRGNPGKVVPAVDRNRCEGKDDCIVVCPYDVFEMQTLSKEDRASLSFKGRIKAWAHGGQQAYVVAPEACHACNLCVDACPEQALKLVAVR